MSTPTQDFWNCIPGEILTYVFSYLPFEDRHTAFHVCRRWAAAVSNSAIWRTTEIWCTTEDMAKGCVLQCLPQFVHHIRHLKIVLDQSQGLYWRLTAQILHMLNWQSHQLKALCIQFHGESPTFCSAFGDSPYFYSGQDILGEL